MSASVSRIISTESRNVAKGNPPKKPTTWIYTQWITLPNGEKHSRQGRANGVTAQDLPHVMGLLLKDLMQEHGNVVDKAGWDAHTHGGASTSKNRKRKR